MGTKIHRTESGTPGSIRFIPLSTALNSGLSYLTRVFCRPSALGFLGSIFFSSCSLAIRSVRVNTLRVWPMPLRDLRERSRLIMHLRFNDAPRQQAGGTASD